MRILLIEDDPILALTFASTLGQGGHHIGGIAYTVAEAYELAATQEDVDLALIDVNLEGNDEGIEVARQLKARFSIPSLFVSGQVAAAQRHRDVALGLMKKPFPPLDLLRAIEAVAYVIGGSSSSTTSPPPALTLFS